MRYLMVPPVGVGVIGKVVGVAGCSWEPSDTT